MLEQTSAQHRVKPYITTRRSWGTSDLPGEEGLTWGRGELPGAGVSYPEKRVLPGAEVTYLGQE